VSLVKDMYKKPELEITEFEVEDITCSGGDIIDLED